MLTIRNEQMKAITAPLRKSFETKMIAHVKEFFPDECEKLGDEGTEKAVRHGVARAESYEITASGPITRYLNLMFTFGWNFDRETSWATAILCDATLEENERVQRLQTCAEAMIHEAQGISMP